MRLWKIEKYWISSYLVLLLLFIAGFSFAADPSKVGNKYIEMSKGKNNAPIIFVEYASLTCPACAASHTCPAAPAASWRRRPAWPSSLKNRSEGLETAEVQL